MAVFILQQCPMAWSNCWYEEGQAGGSLVRPTQARLSADNWCCRAQNWLCRSGQDCCRCSRRENACPLVEGTVYLFPTIKGVLPSCDKERVSRSLSHSAATATQYYKAKTQKDCNTAYDAVQSILEGEPSPTSSPSPPKVFSPSKCK